MTNQTEVMKKKTLNSLGVAALSLGIVALTVGCSTKNYVRSQTAPIVAQTNGLEKRTGDDQRNIQDTDARAQQGIAGAKSDAASADQHAMAAGQSADAANVNAKEAYNRVDSLAGTVAGLDKYKPLSDVSVTFGFDKSVLTAADKKELDAVASSLQTTRHYLLEVTGGTDAVGDAAYNYTLSQRRADAVVTYLATKYNIPPHKFYMVGIGKDQEVATNKTAAGRAKNRRVQVRVLSNMEEEGAPEKGANGN